MQKTLEVIYDMDIEVRFEGGDGQFGDPRYRNSAWDGILRDMVVNSDMLPEAHYYEHLNEAIQNREEGCEYLIITPNDPDFLAWADTLKQFRTKQGILTKVVTTTECGSNEAEDIRNYILNAYETTITAIISNAETRPIIPPISLSLKPPTKKITNPVIKRIIAVDIFNVAIPMQKTDSNAKRKMTSLRTSSPCLWYCRAM